MIRIQQQFHFKFYQFLNGFLISFLLILPVFAASQINEPLIKQTIYLKYINICVCCDSHDQHFIPIVKCLLSKRGEIEFDVRDKTITVTDEQKNVEAIQRFVECYDSLESSAEERSEKCSPALKNV